MFRALLSQDGSVLFDEKVKSPFSYPNIDNHCLRAGPEK
jgi:hypothetical protein